MPYFTKQVVITANTIFTKITNEVGHFEFSEISLHHYDQQVWHFQFQQIPIQRVHID